MHDRRQGPPWGDLPAAALLVGALSELAPNAGHPGALRPCQSALWVCLGPQQAVLVRQATQGPLRQGVSMRRAQRWGPAWILCAGASAGAAGMAAADDPVEDVWNRRQSRVNGVGSPEEGPWTVAGKVPDNLGSKWLPTEPLQGRLYSRGNRASSPRLIPRSGRFIHLGRAVVNPCRASRKDRERPPLHRGQGTLLRR